MCDRQETQQSLQLAEDRELFYNCRHDLLGRGGECQWYDLYRESVTQYIAFVSFMHMTCWSRNVNGVICTGIV